jgi:cytochrome c2
VERFFATAVGWLIALGMLVFGYLGYQAINQATPLSSTHYLAVTTTSTSPTTPSTTTTTSPPPTSTTKPKTSTSTSTTKPPSTAALASLGQTIITAHCQVCHTVNGTGGTIGPNLNDVMAGKTLPGMVPGGHPTEAAWLTKWISNPASVWPQAIMPDLGLSPQQVQEVVAFLTTKVK